MACDHCVKFKLMIGGIIIGGYLSTPVIVSLYGGLIIRGRVTWST